MIVPNISATSFSTDAAGQNRLMAELKRWSLLGRVALSDVESLSAEQLRLIIRKISGAVDLEIALRDPTEADALACLNEGAASIVCTPEAAEAMPGVPDDRVVFWKSSEQTPPSKRDQIKSEAPTASQLAQFEKEGIDCVVDASLLDQNPDLIVDYFIQLLVSDRPDGLWPTIIVDPLGQALGLAYSNEASLRDAITHRRGTYWSRSRNALWVKGATSGATQQLLGVRLDCDRDCLRFQVTQDAPGFCHLKTHTCFGSERSIEAVVQRLGERIASTDAKSFTRKLVRDPEMLRAKLLEEAQELSEAESEDEITWEAADVLYFTLVKMVGHGVPLEAVYHELARRMNRVVRRKNKLEKNDANENSPSNRPEDH